MLNRVAEHRTTRNWTQAELAQRAGLPRTTISAIEIGRIEPSVGAALALAAAFRLSVEELFAVPPPAAAEHWACAPLPGARIWQAEINGALVHLPAEPAFGAYTAHDAVVTECTERGPQLLRRTTADPARTLVIAGCDPALALLAAPLQAAGIRLLLQQRSTSAALGLLRQGHAHVAAMHWGSGEKANSALARKQLGAGFTLLRSAAWEEGLALDQNVHAATSGEALATNLRWVGREAGSGAAHCAEQLFARAGREASFRHLARDHRGVAEAIRDGWAQAGICIRLTAADAGLKFIPLLQENVDLAFATPLAADPRLAALANIYQTAMWQHTLGDLPGYETAHTGKLAHV